MSGPMFSATIVGKEELARKFRRLEGAVKSQVLEKALVSGGLVVANEWKQTAPVLTGDYRRSIHIGGHTGETPGFEGSDMGRQRAEGHGASIVVGTGITDPPYPLYLEKGTRRMTARPSAGPAFKRKKTEAVREIGEAFKDIVRRLTR